MLRDPQTIGGMAHVIQLSVAPVFLLTAIGTLLSVMINRLARIIDRARYHEGRLETVGPEGLGNLHEALATLKRRADLIGHAIFLLTATAVLVCSVIALLFIGEYLRYDISVPVALLFILGMFLMVIGLITFLREIFIAKGSLHIGPN